MKQDDFKPYLASLSRHAMTAISGILAANGVAMGSDLKGQLSSFVSAGIVLAFGVLWSFVDKNQRAKDAVGLLPPTDVSALASTIAELHRTGASAPVLQALAGSLGNIVAAEAAQKQTVEAVKTLSAQAATQRLAAPPQGPFA